MRRSVPSLSLCLSPRPPSSISCFYVCPFLRTCGRLGFIGMTALIQLPGIQMKDRLFTCHFDAVDDTSVICSLLLYPLYHRFIADMQVCPSGSYTPHRSTCPNSNCIPSLFFHPSHTTLTPIIRHYREHCYCFLEPIWVVHASCK